MYRLLSTFLIIVFAALSADAQAVWNRSHLDKVRSQLDRPMYATAYSALLREADAMLGDTPLSVVDKKRMSPAGDKHYYTSLARYFHPNPDTPDGLPYVNRDGITNPEIGQWDRNRLGETAHRISTLGLAWYLSGDERYAAKAAEFIRVWFLDKDTRMYPNFEYAQMVPGVNKGKGRPYGVLDGYSFVELLDGAALLDGSKSWTAKDAKALRKWMSSMLDWMLTSEQGLEEAAQSNNHSTAYDAIAIAMAIYTGRSDLAKKIIEKVPAKRIFTQIEPDGTQPHEMWRTLSYGYSQYNLTHLIDIFLMAGKIGINIDKATDTDGRNFYKALDLLASYLGKDVGAWPGKQINGWEVKQQEVARDLWRAGTLVDSTRGDYRNLYRMYRIFRPEERFTLLYYTPDDVDDAFTKASATLRNAVSAVNAARAKKDNRIGHRLNPCTQNADGTPVLVHPYDWTSGFFPGELWLMYEFTNDPYWRRQAASHTWVIEEAKMHDGTHDLGFMIGDSFGKAWEITGERSYLDVVHQAAKTLATRFNPAVGAIRSWDHNAEVWHYPVIIDNMMNLEMMFKMADATGDRRFHDIAVSHADATLRNHFRDDHSSYHVVDYDPDNGDVRMRVTAQGYSDDSFWSRGQGWGLYGYTMCYRHTGARRYLDHAVAIADWFLSLPNMPSDGIPYWDMKAPGTEHPDNASVPRDASAASLTASGLYELAEYVDSGKAQSYRDKAARILDSLAEAYTLEPYDRQIFLLGHSTGHHPGGSEIDVPLVYADYYYLEALLRKRHKALYGTPLRPTAGTD